ncbi:hypothetical protein [Streptosporangium sp. NPDC048865]|uniref:hypothetical protein n=1 Tax=Streptosporangium sp. NPDC048865 TaxID=3155766 RepID=UPI00341D7A3A
MNAITPPTPKNVADLLTEGDHDYHDGNEWSPSVSATGNVISIGITPVGEDDEELPEVHFRAVVVEGDETPIVLERPVELGMSWNDGGDLLALTQHGIRMTLRGMDKWELSPAEAREMAAQFAAMADACEAALAAQGEPRPAGVRIDEVPRKSFAIHPGWNDGYPVAIIEIEPNRRAHGWTAVAWQDVRQPGSRSTVVHVLSGMRVTRCNVDGTPVVSEA